jgi:hypothetical protein
VLPVVLVVGAVLIDISVARRLPAWAAGLVVTAGVYAAAVAQEVLGVLPPWNWWTVLPVAVGFSVLWTAIDMGSRSAWFAGWRTADESDALAVPAPV